MGRPCDCTARENRFILCEFCAPIYELPAGEYALVPPVSNEHTSECRLSRLYADDCLCGRRHVLDKP
jgi:hypothetical protein